MRLGTAALTLTVALGFVGLASAQESSSWVPSWLSWGAAKTDTPKKTEVQPDLASFQAVANNARLKQAQDDFDRRREVCMKLCEIAIAKGDDALLRKAEMLDQRAYDVYVAVKNQSRAVNSLAPVPDAKKGGR